MRWAMPFRRILCKDNAAFNAFYLTFRLLKAAMGTFYTFHRQ
jgi:hypothetical protein